MALVKAVLQYREVCYKKHNRWKIKTNTATQMSSKF